jgi:tetratricopeptide (TPR) repeat protein
MYKQVHRLAIELLKSADENNEASFKASYAQLKQLCAENINDDHKNHPAQWETLADFTEDLEEALVIYQQALDYAILREAVDYQASITFSMAQLLNELEHFDAAFEKAQSAKALCEHVDDSELLREVIALNKQLISAHKKRNA